jgi:SWI/SNF-related matrix-associated actin-dependent regulator 1 of chromatin subfamily A
MGLGKTVSSLVTALYYRDEWPMLIVCPSSLKMTWQSEIQKWLHFDPDLIQVVNSSKVEFKGLVSIISYDLCRNVKVKLIRRAFKVIIADESHYLKNGKAARTTVLVPLIQQAKRALLLSGTPALSRPIELFPQLQALDRKLFKQEVAFGMRYCNSYQGQFGWVHEGSSNSDELACVLAHTCMIRREKAHVLKDLPEKTRRQVVVTCTKKALKDIQSLMHQRVDLEHKMRSMAGAERSALESQIRILTTKLYGLTGDAKVKECVKYVQDMLQEGNKVLVFAHHQSVLNAVMKALCQAKIAHIRIDGKTPSELRQAHCDRFQTDPNCKAAVLSITAAGTGLTLHAAAMVIFAELYWNPGHLLQAEDRAHRVGQVNNVDVRYLMCAGTLDDVMWKTLQTKADVVGRAVTGATSTMDTAATKQPTKSKGEANGHKLKQTVLKPLARPDACQPRDHRAATVELLDKLRQQEVAQQDPIMVEDDNVDEESNDEELAALADLAEAAQQQSEAGNIHVRDCATTAKRQNLDEASPAPCKQAFLMEGSQSVSVASFDESQLDQAMAEAESTLFHCPLCARELFGFEYDHHVSTCSVAMDDLFSP